MKKIKSSVENIFAILMIGDIVMLTLTFYLLDTAFHFKFTFDSFIANALFGGSALFFSFLLDLYGQVGKYVVKFVLKSLLATALTFSVMVFVVEISDAIHSSFYWAGVGIVFWILQNIWHLFFCRVSVTRMFNSQVVIIGVGEKAMRVRQLIDTSCCLSFSGYIDAPDDMSPLSLVKEDEIVAYIDDIEQYVRRHKPGVLVNALSERRGSLPVAQLLTCKLLGTTIVDYPTFYEAQSGKLPVEDMSPSWLIFNHGFSVTTARRATKRVFDFVLAVVGLLLVLPFFPLVALAIKLNSPGPIFYKQVRVGEHENHFTIYKFRSMTNNAEAATGAVMSVKNDARITSVGKFLRKSRIDELPQLYNVLIGDMSFTGPRPERPEFVEKIKQHTSYYTERHFVKPGLTGWAQIKYPYGDSMGDSVEKLRYDLYYINNLSFWLDIYILLETIKVVLFQKGGR